MTAATVDESVQDDYDARRELSLARRRITELEAIVDRYALMLGLAANAATRGAGCDLFTFLDTLEEVVQ